MDSKELRLFREAYGSIYEGYGKKKEGECVDKEEKGKHNCAKKVCHEQYGEGETIFGQHAVPDENGFVSHYNVQFEHGIVENVSVEDMEIITMVEHLEHVEHEGDMIGENAATYTAAQATADQEKAKEEAQKRREAAKAAKPQSAIEREGAVDRRTRQLGLGAMRRAGIGNPHASGAHEDVDLFDIVKGYLVSEGATEEEALKAMLVLTDEERSAILEEVGIVGPSKKPIDAIPGVRAARIAAANVVKRSDYGPNDEVKKVGKHVVPSARLGGKFDRPGGTKYKDISGDK